MVGDSTGGRWSREAKMSFLEGDWGSRWNPGCVGGNRANRSTESSELDQAPPMNDDGPTRRGVKDSNRSFEGCVRRSMLTNTRVAGTRSAEEGVVVEFEASRVTYNRSSGNHLIS